MRINCCKNISTSQKGESPFIVVGETDYYDGPVEGVMQCHHCLATFRFQMLDWDGNHNVRIFSLASLAPHYFREFMAKITEYPTGSLPIDWDREVVYGALNKLLNNAQPVTLVFAWEQNSNQILAVKEPTEEIQRQIEPLFSVNLSSHKIDWFSYLQLM